MIDQLIKAARANSQDDVDVSVVFTTRFGQICTVTMTRTGRRQEFRNVGETCEYVARIAGKVFFPCRTSFNARTSVEVQNYRWEHLLKFCKMVDKDESIAEHVKLTRRPEIRVDMSCDFADIERRIASMPDILDINIKRERAIQSCLRAMESIVRGECLKCSEKPIYFFLSNDYRRAEQCASAWGFKEWHRGAKGFDYPKNAVLVSVFSNSNDAKDVAGVEAWLDAVQRGLPVISQRSMVNKHKSRPVYL